MNIPPIKLGELKELFPSIHNLAQDLIICCDPGTDDILMQAQVNALATRILGYIPCAGNTALKYTVSNTLLFNEITDRRDVKVYPGSSRPSQATVTSTDESGVHVFGVEGLGTLKLPSPLLSAENQNGVDFAVEAIKRATNPITLVSTGGMTDVCKIVQQLDEESLRKIAAISIMGGVLNPKEANAPLSALAKGIPRWAEFNIIYDPDSAQTIFKITEKFRIPIFLSPLDLTHTLTYKKSEVDSLRKRVDNYVSKIMADLMGDVPLPYIKRFGSEVPQQPAHDLNASMCLFHPDLYQYQRGYITVDGEDSQTPGKTTFTPSEEGNVYVLSVPEERRASFFTSYEEDLMRYNSSIHRIRGYLYDIQSESIAECVACVTKIIQDSTIEELNLSGLLITPLIATALIEILKNNPTVTNMTMSLPKDVSVEMAELLQNFSDQLHVTPHAAAGKITLQMKPLE